MLSAIDLDVKSSNLEKPLRMDSNVPATFEIELTNNGNTGKFNFYNLLGFPMEPSGKILLEQGETKTFEISVYPRDEFSQRGHYILKYFIQAEDDSNVEERFNLNLLNLDSSLFEVGTEDLNPESSTIEVYIQNKENLELNNLKAKFKSSFFNFEKEFSLQPFEKKAFEVKLNSEDFSKLEAGYFTLTAEISENQNTVITEGVIKFVEKDILISNPKKYGFFIQTELIEKANKGNVLVETETVVTKNILSRLFTSFSPEPDLVERSGAQVTYTWLSKISPGETLQIEVKTNWIFPFVIILLVTAIIVLSRQYSKTNLILKKRVSFVKAKGGEFALKVSINVIARNYVEKVNIIDRLPPLVKLYERFGVEKPSNVNESLKRLDWNFEKLEAGERRVLSYIIYSKIGVTGRFALPSTKAIYERNNKIEEAESNRAFFVAEQSKD